MVWSSLTHKLYIEGFNSSSNFFFKKKGEIEKPELAFQDLPLYEDSRFSKKSCLQCYDLFSEMRIFMHNHLSYSIASQFSPLTFFKKETERRSNGLLKKKRRISK